MKKLFVVLTIIAFGFGAISCNKTCRCTGTETTIIEGSIEDPTVKNIDIVVGEMRESDCEVFRYEPTSFEPSATITHDVVCRPE